MEDQPLFAALFVEEEARPWTVSELNTQIKAAVERQFASVWVEGEVVDFRRAASGHWYFNLNDGSSQLKCVCWKGTNFKVRFKPENGLMVRVRGRLTYWEAKGELKLTVESVEPVGEGALLVAFEQIKAKLAGEGLFDESLKRKLPPFPRRIGVITSSTGAALHDILTVLGRRAKSVSVVLVPTAVQGETAGEQIARAIALVNEFCGGCLENEKIDVLIVGRGGGSAEDLWAFNEEIVARAIRASGIPIISAVGHEIDFTIADFVADLRAATPSAAAEIVAHAESEICERIDRRFGKLKDLINMRFMNARNDLQSLAAAPVFSDFPARVNGLRFRVDQAEFHAKIAGEAMIRQRSDELGMIAKRLTPIGLSAKVSENHKRLALMEQRAQTAASGVTTGRQRDLEKAMAKLDALSPLSVLTRGYSITQKMNGEIVRNAHQTSAGEEISIRLSRGALRAEVLEVDDQAGAL
jgi:exodeoxyribonuclease VII large subunit